MFESDSSRSGKPKRVALLWTWYESYRWDPPDALLSGGRSGWPAILSSLKSVLETGKPLVGKLEPPKESNPAVGAAYCF
jgi:hypothetical protein